MTVYKLYKETDSRLQLGVPYLLRHHMCSFYFFGNFQLFLVDFKNVQVQSWMNFVPTFKRSQKIRVPCYIAMKTLETVYFF